MASTSSHYSSVGQSSHVPWWAAPEIDETTTATFLHHLQLSPHSRVVDLGAGFCATAALLWSKAKLAKPVMCVEPSQDMLDRSAGLQGVSTLCQTGEEWAAGGLPGDTDRLYIKGSIHHFDREKLGDTLAGIRSIPPTSLPTGAGWRTPAAWSSTSSPRSPTLERPSRFPWPPFWQGGSWTRP